MQGLAFMLTIAFDKLNWPNIGNITITNKLLGFAERNAQKSENFNFAAPLPRHAKFYIRVEALGKYG